jgi:hypothetical protein
MGLNPALSDSIGVSVATSIVLQEAQIKYQGLMTVPMRAKGSVHKRAKRQDAQACVLRLWKAFKPKSQTGSYVGTSKQWFAAMLTVQWAVFRNIKKSTISEGGKAGRRFWTTIAAANTN